MQRRTSNFLKYSVILVAVAAFMGCGSKMETDIIPTPTSVVLTPTQATEATNTPVITPTPEPTSTPMPEPTSTPTPEPTSTPTPEPTSTPTPEPTSTPTPEPTSTPTPEPTSTPTPEPTSTPTPEPTSTPTPTPTNTPIPTPSPTPVIPEYTFLELDVEGYAFTFNNYVITHELYVRNLPSVYGKVTDTIMVGEPIRLTGQCNETGWFRIKYGNDKEGYFSSTQFSYLEEVPKQVPAWTKEYTFSDMYEKMFAIKDASLYTEPSKKGEKAQVRFIKGNEVWVTGRCNETGWYRVDYGGAVAYVDDECLSIYQQKSKYENCPYPLDSWEDNGMSITAYYVNSPANDTMMQALNLLQNRYPFFTRIDNPIREYVGFYSEGEVYKNTVAIVLEEFPERVCTLYNTNALDTWARCFYVEGDDPEKIEQAKLNVKYHMEYNIEAYGLTGEIVVTDYFVGEYTEGRVFCYDMRIKE